MSGRHRGVRAYVIELTSFRPVDIPAVVAALSNSKKPIRMICLQKADAQDKKLHLKLLSTVINTISFIKCSRVETTRRFMAHFRQVPVSSLPHC